MYFRKKRIQNRRSKALKVMVAKILENSWVYLNLYKLGYGLETITELKYLNIVP